MTNNTIHNVPRELLENIVLCYNEGEFELGTLAAECQAILSAPSPAGVDGLEAVAWVVTGFSSPKNIGRTRRAFVVTKAGAETQHDNWLPHYNRVTTEPLCRLSDAQAIIDGLRGEVERVTGLWELELARAQKAENELAHAALSIDQQAQRIGELEGLLRDCYPGCGLTARQTQSIRERIDAALSAGVGRVK